MSQSGNSSNGITNQFAKRLTELCKTKPSASAVARDLGINRQQFARYLNGESIPRQAINRKIAAYFDVDPGSLFSDMPITQNTRPATTGTTTVSAMMTLLDDARIQPITDEDLEPGFYWQYKTLLRMPGKVIKSLVLISKDENVYRYKRRSSVVYNADVNGSVRNVFHGVFFKQNGYLIMTDVGTVLGDLTFHVFATSNHYDQSIKPGMHMTVGLAGAFGPKSARLFLKKIPEGDNLLAHARKQGVIAKADLPAGLAYILEGNDISGSGILQL